MGRQRRTDKVVLCIIKHFANTLVRLYYSTLHVRLMFSVLFRPGVLSVAVDSLREEEMGMYNV